MATDSSEDAAEQIRLKYGHPRLERIWSKMSDIVVNGQQVDLPYGHRAPSTDATRSRLFPSLSEAGQFVHVGFSYADVTNFGTFSTDSQVLAFQAIIIGYGPDGATTRTLPTDESEAWGRAVLRREWESYIYRVHTDPNRDRLWFLFAALIDRVNGPVSAPADLNWDEFILRYPKNNKIEVTRIK